MEPTSCRNTSGSSVGRSGGKPVPVPEHQTVHGLQKGEQFRFRKLVRMVADQHASRCQVHLDRFDFGRACPTGPATEGPFPLRRIDLLQRRDAQSQPAGQPMDDPRA